MSLLLIVLRYYNVLAWRLSLGSEKCQFFQNVQMNSNKLAKTAALTTDPKTEVKKPIS